VKLFKIFLRVFGAVTAGVLNVTQYYNAINVNEKHKLSIIKNNQVHRHFLITLYKAG
jgi:hypothetical protein